MNNCWVDKTPWPGPAFEPIEIEVEPGVFALDYSLAYGYWCDEYDPTLTIGDMLVVDGQPKGIVVRIDISYPGTCYTVQTANF